MDINKNYYDILGVDKSASESEIKKVFRKKANELHPDKHGGDDTDFKIINDAYQIIGDKKKRAQYDKQSPHGNNYNPMGGFSDFFHFGNGGGFSMNFGGGFDPFEMFFNRRSEFIENLDIRLNIKVSLKDVYNNKDISIKYEREVTCDTCNGTGFDPDSDSDICEICDGKGKTWEPSIGYVKCKYCRGTGRIHTDTCKKCNGEKVIPKKEEFHLNNVYRITESDEKYLSGYGNQSKHYQNRRGNLILNIIYTHDDKYIRKPDGLYYKMDVHYEDAIKGNIIEYEHLDNKKYNLTIPPGTKDGDILKMPKMGMLFTNKDRQNLYFILNIIIDYNKL